MFFSHENAKSQTRADISVVKPFFLFKNHLLQRGWQKKRLTNIPLFVVWGPHRVSFYWGERAVVDFDFERGDMIWTPQLDNNFEDT